MRCLQMRIRHQNHFNILPLLKIVDRLALFIKQIGGHIDRKLGADSSRIVLLSMLFDHSQNRQRQRTYSADRTLAITARADILRPLPQ